MINTRNIIFVYNSSPTLGRAPPFTSLIFSWFKESSYIDRLSVAISDEQLEWQVKLDDTESDIEKIEKTAAVIICAPGLKYQFYTGSFNKKNIIYLSTMEYKENDVTRVINLLKRIDMEMKDHDST
ncbi:nitrogen fixation protein NifS (plasmid) [Edwardsiella tarda]|uniref:nitrogen fixation protein NifS n=1 Tax=Edwardsiella tarda TaxID=636 RepID=UPI00244393EB|nr:nitrogen fixation protein NifS [Edwardsiella tarda]WGE30953.1 nitrogen fixation protein NifS [Edwardsiella tarda]